MLGGGTNPSRNPRTVPDSHMFCSHLIWAILSTTNTNPFPIDQNFPFLWFKQVDKNHGTGALNCSVPKRSVYAIFYLHDPACHLDFRLNVGKYLPVPWSTWGNKIKKTSGILKELVYRWSTSKDSGEAKCDMYGPGIFTPQKKITYPPTV